jgi:predicted RNase H-like HicB family nuclease
MEKKKYVYFFDNKMWIGHWEEFPDYMTQGETLEELQENLKDIHQELCSGNIPCVRHVGELEIA